MSNRSLVLVTGGLGGIGASLVETLSTSGYDVLSIDKEDSPDQVGLNHLRFDIRTLALESASQVSLLETVRERFPGQQVAGIVNNAAVQILGAPEELTTSDFEVTFQTNVFAAFFITQAFLSDLKDQRGGVVNIGSIHSQLTKQHFSAYATSKGALVALTQSLAVDLAPDVRVNCVIPAATDTPMLRASFEDEEAFKRLGEYHPLNRVAHPAEIGEVVKFLLGPQSSFITGSTIRVDGGIGNVLSDPVTIR